MTSPETVSMTELRAFVTSLSRAQREVFVRWQRAQGAALQAAFATQSRAISQVGEQLNAAVTLDQLLAGD
ncbi:MAG TPA: hypothetical protein PLX09_02640 [Xanthomonadaceae bacterium]|nr:hypothetical protein [Xanthomonadaceae bacterium]